MPLRKEATATRVQLCVRPTQACVYARNAKKKLKVGTDTEVVKALKENNDSLAAALDECRQSLRDLHEDFVVLQKERQQLLERVVSLESKLCTQQRQISEQIYPVLKLLSQSEKNLSDTRQSLTGLLITKTSSGCQDNLFSPSLSPIHNATESFYLRPHSSTLLCQPHIEKTHKQVWHKTKKYPKTPHPVLAVPTPEELSSVPKALNFDEEVSVIPCGDTAPPDSVEPGDLGSATVLCDVIEEVGSAGKPRASTESGRENSVTQDCEREAGVLRQRARRAHTTLSVSSQEPGFKSKSTLKSNPKVVSKKKAASELSTKPMVNKVRSSRPEVHATSVRPKRACSSLSVSYQEPSLKRKLRRDENSSTSVMSTSNEAEPIKLRTRVKCPLQDVTNKTRQ